MEADAEGMALLTQMRAGGTAFLRIKCTSPDLAGVGFPYIAQFDAAVKISEPGQQEDADGVYAVNWGLEPVYDAAWGKAMQIEVTNKQTAL
jgi:hypothetical protein